MNSKKIFMMLVSVLLGTATFSQTIVLNEETNGSTVTTCNAILYDSGGPDGNYSNNENYTITFCSESNWPIMVEVLSLRTEGNSYDYIKLYNGENTSGELLATLGGASLPLQTEYVSSGSCVTIQWHSDGGLSYSGFELNIRCVMPCQEYSVGITTNAQYSGSENAYLGCYGTMVSAQINFQHNNENYDQTIDNTNFSWKVLGSNGTQVFLELGLDELSEPFEHGAYFVTLATSDANGCQVLSDTLVLYISVPPTFIGTTATPSVYLGDTVELNGIVVLPDEWQIDMTSVSVNNERFCFNNGENANVEQSSCFNFVGFAPNLTITSAEDIQSVGVNMNHSYMSDLDVYLQCPDGRRVSLFSQSCGGAYFGEPTDLDEPYPCDDGWVGIGYDYYWTEGENNGLMSENCTANALPLPSGSYQPVGNFSELIGCPINGEWCIVFVNHHFASYGTVFRTELNLADNIRPTISFQNTYSNEMWWEGESILNDGYVANNFAVPTTVGQVEYTFSATDNFGCTYDTILYVNVLPATGIDEIPDDDILLFPNPVNDILTISSSEAISEIEIVNDRGQVVTRRYVNGNTSTCNVSELASGMYVVRIYTIRPFASTLRQAQCATGGETQGVNSVIERKFVKE